MGKRNYDNEAMEFYIWWIARYENKIGKSTDNDILITRNLVKRIKNRYNQLISDETQS